MKSYFVVSCCEGGGKGTALTRNQNRNTKVKKSVHNIKTTEESSKEPNRTSKLQPQCSICKKTDHLLNAYVKFKAATRENKLNFVKENSLCFGCLRKGHMSNHCKKRLTCSTCNKNHPTCLHEESHHLRSQKKRREVKNKNPPILAGLLHVHRKAPPVPAP